MTTAVFNSLRAHKKVRDKIEVLDFTGINYKLICFFGFLVCLPMLVLYVWQVNGLTSGCYLINTYGRQISKLSEENKKLQVSFAESGFLGQVLQEVQSLNFQKVTSVKYIKIPENSVGYNYKK